MTYTDPKLTLTFTGGDLPAGHSTTQTIPDTYIINRSIKSSRQLLNGLKSSSAQLSMQISRSCPSTEDIIATSGDILAVFSDDDVLLFTGYVSTNFSWRVTLNGEQVLQITLEDVGTRLFELPYIETGRHFFNGTASAAILAICTAAGVTVRASDQNVLTQSVSYMAEAGQTCRQLLDQLFYECNAVYYFNASGELCVQLISADTSGAPTVNSLQLCDNNGQVINLTKKIRSYKGARVTYTELATATNYLVYRNTTEQDSGHPYCNLPLAAGEWFDGTEIYTAQEWSEATADTFREPTLISAVNASSEAAIVGSGEIVNISNLAPSVTATTGLTCVFSAAGGPFFQLTAHNPNGSTGYFTRMDLFADIVYVKSHGVIRTDTTNVSTGKGLLEEELSWIHDKDNAEAHANLVAQYNRHCGASYSFYTNTSITLGSVIRLNDNLYTGLDTYVLVYSREDGYNDLVSYKAVAVSTFDLSEKAYYQTNEQGSQSGTQGPPGPQGDSVEIEYALGTYLQPVYPPSEAMTWAGDPMEWDSEVMQWGLSPWSSVMPAPVRGMCIWMRQRVGTGPWEYTRLTGLMAWEPQCVGVATTELPTETQTGELLIYGDYFIAGEEFTDDGVTYQEGFAYVYDGNGYWSELNISDPANIDKALNCANALITSGVNVTSSTSSIYGWFRNLVSQNGVFANLFARNLQVGEGTGESGTGFRFRAQEYNQNGQKLENPRFDVYFGDRQLFNVTTDGKIYFGTNFYYDPSYNDNAGAIRSTNDNVVIGAGGDIDIKNGWYRSNLQCASFRSMPKDPPSSPTYLDVSGGATAQINTMYNNVGTANPGVLVPCLHSGASSVKFMKYTYEGSYQHFYRFIDASGNEVGRINGMRASSSGFTYAYSTWANTSFTLTLGSASDVAFQLLTMDGTSLSIGTLTNDTRKGELYYVADSGGTTGTVHIKL